MVFTAYAYDEIIPLSKGRAQLAGNIWTNIWKLCHTHFTFHWFSPLKFSILKKFITHFTNNIHFVVISDPLFQVLPATVSI